MSVSFQDFDDDGVVNYEVKPVNDEDSSSVIVSAGRLQELKRREEELMELLAALRQEKSAEILTQPLTIGVVGFGNFGQFLSSTFVKHGRVIGMSRTDYTEAAEALGAEYISISDAADFFRQVDVVLLAVSIKSFEATLRNLAPHIQNDMTRRNFAGIQGPLFVDVLSVKEHPRKLMLDILPPECDILCTHPMFGPISGANGWNNLKFIYEKTRVNKKLLDSPDGDDEEGEKKPALSKLSRMTMRSITHTHCEDEPDATIKGMDRMERFLSIWEAEGCEMTALSCQDHDEHAAKSQFITHLMGRVLGAQGLAPTPVDTKGFESVLALVDSTSSDSYDLFYGLYKYNQYSLDTIFDLRKAMDNVVENLRQHERSER